MLRGSGWIGLFIDEVGVFVLDMDDGFAAGCSGCDSFVDVECGLVLAGIESVRAFYLILYRSRQSCRPLPCLSGLATGLEGWMRQRVRLKRLYSWQKFFRHLMDEYVYQSSRGLIFSSEPASILNPGPRMTAF